LSDCIHSCRWRCHSSPSAVKRPAPMIPSSTPLSLAPHRNVTATIALGLEQPFSIRVLGDDSIRGGEAWRREWIALIPPGTLHHLQAKGFMGFVYLDPLSDDHQRLASSALGGAHPRVRAALAR